MLRTDHPVLISKITIAGSVAVGVCGIASILAVLNYFFLAPLPVSEAETLFYVYTSSRGAPYNFTSYQDFVDIRNEAKSFEAVTAFKPVPVGIDVTNQARQVWAELVAPDYFDVIGVRPSRGRTFVAESPGDAGSVVVSERLAESLFPDEASVVGKDVRVNGQMFSIIGVVPHEFAGMFLPGIGFRFDVWIPISENDVTKRNISFIRRASRSMMVVGRLTKHSGAVAASDELRALSATLAEEFPVENEGQVFVLESSEDARLPPALRTIGYVLGALLGSCAGVIFVFAMANAGGALASRLVKRSEEITLRLALGARPAHVFLLVFRDAAVPAVGGGALGYAGSYFILAAISRLQPPTEYSILIDPRPGLGLLAVSLAVGVVVGAAAAVGVTLRAIRHNRLAPMAGTTATASRNTKLLTQWISAAQLAFSLAFLAVGGLFVQQYLAALDVDPGFRVESLLFATVDPALGGNPELTGGMTESALTFYEDVVNSTEALLGVRRTALADRIPFGLAQTRTYVRTTPEAQELGAPDITGVTSYRVTSSFFDVMGIELVRGRSIQDDTPFGGARQAVVSDTFASLFWPGQDPIGETVAAIDGDEEMHYEVVGVSADIRTSLTSAERVPVLFLSLMSDPRPRFTVLVDTSTSPDDLTAAVGDVLHALEPTLPIVDLRPFEEQLGEARFGVRASASIVTGLSLLAFVLAISGMCGAFLQNAMESRRELAIRSMLGAQEGALVRWVATSNLRTVFLGTALGWPIALAAVKAVGTVVPIAGGPSPILGAVSALALLAGLAASLVPVHTVREVDAMMLLRE